MRVMAQLNHCNYSSTAVFVTHGGLGRSTSLMTLAEIDKLNRFEEPGVDGEVSQLLWSGEGRACITFV